MGVVRFVLFLVGAALYSAPTEPSYHITAHPWQPLSTPKARYLDAIEGECRFTTKLQNEKGAIIDPFLKVEHQYATPYFAYAVGTLLEAGRGRDLVASGSRAMEHATEAFANGRDAIPEQHGEFFIAVLTGALPLYEHHVPREQWLRWRERMKTPTAKVIRGVKNNWETYVMKGDWMRYQAGLLSRGEAVEFIETAWRDRHSKRIAATPWFLYHDRTSDPDTLSVEAVGRGNLLAMVDLGYDGPSAAAIRKVVEAATANTMLLQDPTGQVPANGRTDNHVWVEIGYQLAFEVMAERAWRDGRRDLAGQYRRAALLAFHSAQRWRRMDGEWKGSYRVTKNRLDPALRVGYQPASQYTNYNGSLMFHLAEAFHVRETEIPEKPTASEIGGYAFALDEEFSSAFANAGGMFVQADLRGQEKESHANYWTPLGIVRFSRAGWESRLGPSDGAFNGERGVSFAPAFEENGAWKRMADLPRRYSATWNVEFVHPLLVRCSLSYQPKPGATGPSFRNDLVITPSGVLSEVRLVSGDVPWGVTWPVLESDGTPLRTAVGDGVAMTGYPEGRDEQAFLAVSPAPRLDASQALIRSTFGDLRPVLMTTADSVSRTFVYPRSAGDPPAAAVRSSFQMTSDGFSSALGRVSGTVWIGPTVAGGVADRLDVDGDGRPDLQFSRRCGFMARIHKGAVTEVETDQPVSVMIGGKSLQTQAYVPILLSTGSFQ